MPINTKQTPTLTPTSYTKVQHQWMHTQHLWTMLILCLCTFGVLSIVGADLESYQRCRSLALSTVASFSRIFELSFSLAFSCILEFTLSHRSSCRVVVWSFCRIVVLSHYRPSRRSVALSFSRSVLSWHCHLLYLLHIQSSPAVQQVSPIHCCFISRSYPRHSHPRHLPASSLSLSSLSSQILSILSDSRTLSVLSDSDSQRSFRFSNSRPLVSCIILSYCRDPSSRIVVLPCLCIPGI